MVPQIDTLHALNAIRSIFIIVDRDVKILSIFFIVFYLNAFVYVSLYKIRCTNNRLIF